MNYLAHGFAFTDEPTFLAGTALPDWLSVVDRRVRVRQEQVQAWVEDAHEPTAALARGIVQHHRDDLWFHDHPVFIDLCAQLTVRVRSGAPEKGRFRPGFAAHVLTELLLDSALMENDGTLLDRYYEALGHVDLSWITSSVSRFAGRSAEKLSPFIQFFLEERFLEDYLRDAKICTRLNQVLRRAGLAELSASFAELLPELRRIVYPKCFRILPRTHPTPD
ncbi:MAG: hypothetical protein V3T77_09560 [Planctomycetota bacterium]